MYLIGFILVRTQGCSAELVFGCGQQPHDLQNRLLLL